MNKQTILKRLVFVTLGIIWALVIAEIVTRALVAQGSFPSRLPSDLFAGHPVGWSMEPNLDAVVPSGTGLIRIRANSIGFRDRDYPEQPEPDHRRVLILGDSFVAAIETPQEQTFHELLESRYEGEIDVVSMGMSGYQTTQEYLLYQHTGHDYHPDIVVLMLYVGNDIIGVQPRDPNLPYFVLEENGALALHQYPYTGKFTAPIAIGGQSTPLMKLSRLAFLVGLAWRARHTEGTQSDTVESGAIQSGYCNYVAEENFSHPSEQQWALEEVLLMAMRDEIEADGHSFRIAVIPTEFEIEDEQKAEYLKQCPQPKYLDDPPKQDRLIPFLERHGISYLDLRDPLAAAREESDQAIYLDSVDTHWTLYGHTVVAEALYEWLDSP